MVAIGRFLKDELGHAGDELVEVDQSRFVCVDFVEDNSQLLHSVKIDQARRGKRVKRNRQNPSTFDNSARVTVTSCMITAARCSVRTCRQERLQKIDIQRLYKTRAQSAGHYPQLIPLLRSRGQAPLLHLGRPLVAQQRTLTDICTCSCRSWKTAQNSCMSSCPLESSSYLSKNGRSSRSRRRIDFSGSARPACR